MLKKSTYTLIFISLLGMGLIACTPSTQQATEANLDEGIQALAVPSQDELSVLAEGVVVPVASSDISFQISGVASEVLVTEGESVAAGDVLVRLDTVDLAIQRDQAEARLNSAQSGLLVAQSNLESARSGVSTAGLQVEAAEAQLNLVKVGARPEEIEAAEKQLTAAEANVTQAVGQRNSAVNAITGAQIAGARAQLISAQAQLLSVENAYDNIINACFDVPGKGTVCPLYGPVEEQTRAQLEAARLSEQAASAQVSQLEGGATPGQRNAAQGGVTLALANVEVAKAQLALVQQGASAEQITQAEVSVKQAQASIKIAEAGILQAEAAVTQAEAGVKAAEAGLASADLALSRTEIKSTISGIVSSINIEVGELVNPGVPVVVVADFGIWEIKTTDLTELDVARVGVGADVSIEFDAIPGQTLNGVVTDVSLISTISQGDVVYEVTISLVDTDGLPIRWGMTAFVNVE
ncbi:MAG: HlyD family secretion protein [Cellvibrionaceae bacterium]|jgi:HlyD family secretion protein